MEIQMEIQEFRNSVVALLKQHPNYNGKYQIIFDADSDFVGETVNIKKMCEVALDKLDNPNRLINLTDGCMKGSMCWYDRVREVMETKPEDFIFYTDVFGENKLSELLSDFKDRDAVRNEVLDNLVHYARFDLASMYSILKNDRHFETI